MKTFAEILSALDTFRRMNVSFSAPGQLREALLVWLATEQSYNTTQVRQFVSAFFEGGLLEADLLSLDPAERAFARHITSLRRYATFQGNPPPADTTLWTTESSEDFLADDAGSWGIFRMLNLLLMSAIPPNRKVAIVTSVRDEGISILEWIAHYRALGVRDIFVYTNDNSDGSEAILEILAQRRVINLIYNKVATAKSIQDKVMEHSLHMLDALRDYEWVFYIDVDEFFLPRTGNKATLIDVLQKLDSTFDRDPPSSISFHWKWFGSENQFRRTDGLLLERFVHSIHNEHVKSLVKLRDVVSMRRVHIPILLPSARGVTSDLQPFDLRSVGTKPIYGTGQLNHYWNKSFQEFAIKRKRGRISRPKEGDSLDFSTFFLWGANGRRGNLDPAPAEIVARTKQALVELLAIPEMPEAAALVEGRFHARVAELDHPVALLQTYKDHVANNVTAKEPLV